MNIDLVALVTALGLGTVLKTLVDWWIASRKERKANDKAFTQVFKDVHEVYYVLLTMLRNCKADRVVVLKTTNGGGRPTLTGNLYSTVMYEAFEYPLQSVKSNWQNQLLDSQYMSMLFEMNKTGKLVVVTDALPQGILKDLYQKHGIVKSWVYRIHERETEYIYLSVNFTQNEADSPELSDLFRSGVSSLKNLFSKNSKI